MKIIKSGAELSPIVKIAQQIRTLGKQTGKQYLPLNRGVNSVCNIDLTHIVKHIDFNTTDIQAYPPATGRPDLKDAINNTYFNNNAAPDKIIITAGSTMGLDLTFQTTTVDKIYIPAFYWTTYDQIMKIRNKQSDVYQNYPELIQNLPKLKNAAVIISDPGNPIGDKYNDTKLLELLEQLNQNGTTIIMDSPYRRMFFDSSDTLYQKLMTMENAVIIESFSKWIGLSGQRIAFVYSANNDFIDEFRLRLAAATNGINTFSQILVQKLLATPEGISAIDEFKHKTLTDMARNIKYLQDHNLLANQLYRDTTPVGIFVAVDKSPEELLAHHIGSISLSYFTRTRKEEAEKLSRICASFPHQTFKRFFDNMLNR